MSSLDEYLNDNLSWKIDNNFFGKVNQIGQQGVELFRRGDFENAELFKVSELSYLEIALNTKDNFNAELICGAGYATLGNIYFKQKKDDTLPILMGYVRLSQGATHLLNKKLEINLFLSKSLQTLEYVSYMLLKKKDWDCEHITKDLESFPTVLRNEKAIGFYENAIPNLHKKDIVELRKKMKYNGLF